MPTCDEAMRAADEAAAAYGEAKARVRAAEKKLKDDTATATDGHRRRNFVACLATSGALGIIGTPILGTVGAVTCIAVAEKEFYDNKAQIDADGDELLEASREERDARKNLEDAQDARKDACAIADGCGSRGGPGYRRPDGKCAGWDDWA